MFVFGLLVRWELGVSVFIKYVWSGEIYIADFKFFSGAVVWLGFLD